MYKIGKGCSECPNFCSADYPNLCTKLPNKCDSFRCMLTHPVKMMGHMAMDTAHAVGDNAMAFGHGVGDTAMQVGHTAMELGHAVGGTAMQVGWKIFFLIVIFETLKVPSHESYTQRRAPPRARLLTSRRSALFPLALGFNAAIPARSRVQWRHCHVSRRARGGALLCV